MDRSNISVRTPQHTIWKKGFFLELWHLHKSTITCKAKQICASITKFLSSCCLICLTSEAFFIFLICFYQPGACILYGPVGGNIIIMKNPSLWWQQLIEDSNLNNYEQNFPHKSRLQVHAWIDTSYHHTCHTASKPKHHFSWMFADISLQTFNWSNA